MQHKTVFATTLSAVDQQFLRAVKEGNVNKIKRLFKNNPKPNPNARTDDQHHTPAIALAALSGNLEIVRYLHKEQHAIVDIEADSLFSMNQTPIVAAINGGDSGVLQYLLETVKANPEINSQYCTPIFSAIAARNHQAVILLHQAKANLGAVNNEGHMPLDYVKTLLDEDRGKLQQLCASSKQSRGLDKQKPPYERSIVILVTINSFIYEKLQLPSEQKLEPIIGEKFSAPRLQIDLHIGRKDTHAALLTLQDWKTKLEACSSQSSRSKTDQDSLRAAKYSHFDAWHKVIELLYNNNEKQEAHRYCVEVLTAIQSEQAILVDSDLLDKELDLLELRLYWPEDYDVILTRTTTLTATIKDDIDSQLHLYYLTGYIYFCQKQYTPAEAAFKKILDLIKSKNPIENEEFILTLANQGLGNVYLQQKKHAESFRAFTIASQNDNSEFRTSTNSAIVLNKDFLPPCAGLLEVGEPRSSLADKQRTAKPKKRSSSSKTKLPHQSLPTSITPKTTPAGITNVHTLSADENGFHEVTGKKKSAKNAKPRPSSTVTVITTLNQQPTSDIKNSAPPAKKQNAVPEIKIDGLPALLAQVCTGREQLPKEIIEAALITTLQKDIAKFQTEDKDVATDKAALQALWKTTQSPTYLATCCNLQININGSKISLMQMLYPQWQNMKTYHKKFTEELNTIAQKGWIKPEERCYQVAVSFLTLYAQSLFSTESATQLKVFQVLQSPSARVLKKMLDAEQQKQLVTDIERAVQTLNKTPSMKLPTVNLSTLYATPPAVVTVLEPTTSQELDLVAHANSMGCIVVKG